MEENSQIPIKDQIDSRTTLEVLKKLIQTYSSHYKSTAKSENAIAIGKCLMSAKSKLLHGEFQGWLKKEFLFSLQTARKFMQIYNRFGITRYQKHYTYSVSQMIEMLALTEVDTAKFIAVQELAGTPVEQMSIRQLRDEVKKYTALYKTCNEEPVEKEKNSGKKRATFSKKRATLSVESGDLEVIELIAGLNLLSKMPSNETLKKVIAKKAERNLLFLLNSMDIEVLLVCWV